MSAPSVDSTPNDIQELLDELDYNHDSMCVKATCSASPVAVFKTCRYNMRRDDGLVGCFDCGNIWDGQAQCLCFGYLDRDDVFCNRWLNVKADDKTMIKMP